MIALALASAALFLGAGGSIKGIWTVTNSQLTSANSSEARYRPPAGPSSSSRSEKRAKVMRFDLEKGVKIGEQTHPILSEGLPADVLVYEVAGPLFFGSECPAEATAVSV